MLPLQHRAGLSSEPWPPAKPCSPAPAVARWASRRSPAARPPWFCPSLSRRLQPASLWPRERDWAFSPWHRVELIPSSTSHPRGAPQAALRAPQLRCSRRVLPALGRIPPACAAQFLPSWTQRWPSGPLAGGPLEQAGLGARWGQHRHYGGCEDRGCLRAGGFGFLRLHRRNFSQDSLH